MPKVLVTADIHIHAHRNDQRRVEDGIACLEWIYETARIAGIKTVIIAGDFFHHRFSLSTLAMAKAMGVVWASQGKVSLASVEAENKVAATVESGARDGIKTIFLLGNHDMFYEDDWKIHSLSTVKEWATVIDAPTKMLVEGVEVDFLPYTPTPSKYINSPPFEKPARTLISHLAIANAILNAKYNILSVEDDSKEKEHIDPEKLHKWEKVWLGHYHYGQRVSSQVEYIGSPMQLTFSEAGQSKHVAIYDLETLETTYVVNKISPQFHIVEDQADIDKLDMTDAYVQMLSSEVIEAKFEHAEEIGEVGCSRD
jgi:DNA repair exonuclease SbcCD nuclease subunit